MADNEGISPEQIEKEKQRIKKMISEDKIKEALAKAKELEKQHVYTKQEFLSDAEECGAETEDLKKLLSPAWFVGSGSKGSSVKKKIVKRKIRKR